MLSPVIIKSVYGLFSDVIPRDCPIRSGPGCPFPNLIVSVSVPSYVHAMDPKAKAVPPAPVDPKAAPPAPVIPKAIPGVPIIPVVAARTGMKLAGNFFRYINSYCCPRYVVQRLPQNWGLAVSRSPGAPEMWSKSPKNYRHQF
jgi:hypothetical protein